MGFKTILDEKQIQPSPDKSCKILQKFLPTLHFVQESYKFVQESQNWQVCYNVDHFLQYSDNISAKISILRKSSYKSAMSNFDQKLVRDGNKR